MVTEGNEGNEEPNAKDRQARGSVSAEHWQERTELDAFWHDMMDFRRCRVTHEALQRAQTISDAEFCELCQRL